MQRSGPRARAKRDAGPMMQARQERMVPLLLYLFTAVTGLVDAVSYIGLGHIFIANMTGNIVLLGFAAAGCTRVVRVALADSSRCILSWCGDRRPSCDDIGAALKQSVEDDYIWVRGHPPARINAGVDRRGSLRLNPLVCRHRPYGPGDGAQERHCSKDRSARFDHHGLDTDDYWAGSGLFFCGRQQSTMAKTSNFHSPDVRWSVRRCTAAETLADLAFGGGNSFYCLWHGSALRQLSSRIGRSTYFRQGS